MIDGCSRWRAIFTIIVPAIMPGVVSSGAFAFVNAWNEFIFSLNFINQSSKFTLPIGLSMMKGEFTIQKYYEGTLSRNKNYHFDCA